MRCEYEVTVRLQWLVILIAYFLQVATAQIINSIIRVDDPKDQEALLDIIGDFFCNRGDHSNHLHEGR